MPDQTEIDLFGPSAEEGAVGTEAQLAASEEALAAKQALEAAVAAVQAPPAVALAPVMPAIPRAVDVKAEAAYAEHRGVQFIAPAVEIPEFGAGGGPAEINSDGNLADAPDMIFLFSGGMIRPLAPRVEDINIKDIAHALSNQCRFTGHTSTFYSVAEHCVLTMRAVADPALRLTALLHDASEAYLADIARPVKKAPGFAETYLAFEGALEVVIAQAYGLVYPFPEEITLADDAMLAREIHSLMPRSLAERWPEPHYTVPLIESWDPQRAEVEFKHAYFSLTGIPA